MTRQEEHGGDPGEAPIELGHATLELAACRILRDGDELPLTQLETRLLRYLLGAGGAVVSSSELLVRVWGYHASVESKAPALTVARLRRKLERDHSAPEILLTAFGQGFRLVLPETDRSWVGRTAEVHQLSGAARPVLVWGRAGVGKSTLLRRVAATQGWVWVDLHGVTADEQAWGRTLRAMGIDSRPPTLASVKAALAELPDVVLVLDGVDALATGGEALVGALPPARLVVGRRAGWDLWGWSSLEVGPLPDAAARELMRVRLHQLDPDAVVDESALARVIRLLDHNPLSIEVAARRAAVVGLDALGRALEEPRVEGDELLIRMHHAAWSRLDLTTQRVVHLVSWSGAPIAVVDVLGVAQRVGWTDVDDGAVLRALRGHLVMRTGDGRLSVLPPLDVIARAWTDTTDAAFVAHAVADAERLYSLLWGPEHGTALETIRRHEGLWRRASRRAEPDDAARLDLPLAEMEVSQIPGASVDHLLAGAQRASSPELRMLCAQAACRQLNLSGAPRRALTLCREALARDGEGGTDPRLVVARGRLQTLEGALLAFTGQPLAGIEHMRRLLSEGLPPHEHWLRGNLMLRLAAVVGSHGEPEEARELYEDSIVALERCGATAMAATARRNLGTLLYHELRCEEALALLEQAERELAAVGETLAAGYAVRQRAVVLIALGRYAEAWALLQDVLDDCVRRGWRQGEGRARCTWARLLDARGDHEAAQAELRRARRLARACGITPDERVATLELAWSLHRQGALDQAVGLYQEAMDERGLIRLLLSRITGEASEAERARRELRRGPRRLSSLADDAVWPGLVARSWEARMWAATPPTASG